MCELFDCLGSGEEVEVQLVPRLGSVCLREQLHLSLPLFGLQQSASLPAGLRILVNFVLIRIRLTRRKKTRIRPSEKQPDTDTKFEIKNRI